jgi:NAD(P)-dependent dehydrogenase (short-subunit alcohol dehydrogenase family)
MTQQAALITGAGRRLGRAMALALAEDGYAVAVHYNSSAEDAEGVVADIRAKGGHAIAVQAELLDWDDCASLVPRASEALGAPLTTLINNASIFEYDNVATFTRENWQRHIGSNLRAPAQLIQAFADQVPDAPRDANGEPVANANVVNMIDMRVRKPTPEFYTYSIAKHGAWAMTQMAAQGLAPRIRVNAIGPGPTMQGARQSAEHFAKQRAATILERGSDPTEIIAALRFLLSVDGFTGQLLCLDGGQHLAWKTPDVLGVE